MNSNTEIYWLYTDPKHLIDLGVDESTIYENINEVGLIQAELSYEQIEELIPKDTQYCYGENGACPFYDVIPHFPSQANGYCHFLNMCDGSQGGLLWVYSKGCGVNENDLD